MYYNANEILNLPLRKENCFPGAFVVKNEKTNQIIVGKSDNVLMELRKLLIGSGTNEIKEAYLGGYRLRISIYALKDSRYRSLDDLENRLKVINGITINKPLQQQTKEKTEKTFFENSLSPKEILNFAKVPNHKEYTGVYIIHNCCNGKNYVGQSTRMVQRLSNHFRGRGGNPDVYYDYRNGDQFEIAIIALCDTKYSSLDELERVMIEKYSACEKGYNKNRGNS